MRVWLLILILVSSSDVLKLIEKVIKVFQLIIRSSLHIRQHIFQVIQLVSLGRFLLFDENRTINLPLERRNNPMRGCDSSDAHRVLLGHGVDCSYLAIVRRSRVVGSDLVDHLLVSFLDVILVLGCKCDVCMVPVEINEPILVKVSPYCFGFLVLEFGVVDLDEGAIGMGLEIVPKIKSQNPIKRSLNQIFKVTILDYSSKRHLLIIIDGKVDLLDRRERECHLRAPLLLVEPLLSDADDVAVLFCVADGRLLKLCAFYRHQAVVVASLEHLNQDDHLLVFHEVEGANSEVEGVVGDQLLDLCLQLANTGLVDVSVASCVVLAGFDRIDP